MILKMVMTVVFLSVVSICLLQYDLSRNPIDDIDKVFKSKSLMIYGLIMLTICMGISIVLATVYTENTYLFNLKRICLLSLLWPIGYIDFKTYRIPNRFIIAGIIYRVVILGLEFIWQKEGLFYTVRSDLIAALVLLVAAVLCAVVAKNSIGFGDMKLFLIMGLLLGTEGIWSAIFVSLVISFVIAVFLLLTKKKTRKDAIPFGPSLMIGTYLAVFLTGM